MLSDLIRIFESESSMLDPGTIHIGMAIRWARLNRKLTCAAVAQELACNRSWLYRVESGRHSPSYEFVESAASLFGFEVEDMRCGMLAERLNSLTASQKELMRKKVEQLPGESMDAIRYAAKGVRLPSIACLRAVAESLKMTVGELVYGDESQMTVEK